MAANAIIPIRRVVTGNDQRGRPDRLQLFPHIKSIASAIIVEHHRGSVCQQLLLAQLLEFFIRGRSPLPLADESDGSREVILRQFQQLRCNPQFCAGRDQHQRRCPIGMSER